MTCPDGYREDTIAPNYYLSHIAENEGYEPTSWQEVTLNPKTGQPFTKAESRDLPVGTPVCVLINHQTSPIDPPQNHQYILVSKNHTYFKSSPDLQVSGKDENTVKALEKDNLICKVPHNSEFPLREYPQKIRSHWHINLQYLHQGKYEWYAYESDFNEPEMIN
ncbi:MAG: hypothetical protein QNJ36_14230 [Calothrix sp. MO_167.B42]|nr:hypothetical protein [Calothrix sp. MO_167.B42]